MADKNETLKNPQIVWIKRVLALSAIILWVYIIYTIASSSAPFMEQAPYCMASTMLIFGLLSMSFKGLEHWERTKTKDHTS